MANRYANVHFIFTMPINNKYLLIIILAVTGCNIFSSKTDNPFIIEYKQGLTSQYEYTYSVLYPDTTEFIQEHIQLVTTLIKSSNDNIVVDDSLLSGLTNMQITVDNGSNYLQTQNVWYLYSDGFFTEHAYTQPIGYEVFPKLLKLDAKKSLASNLSMQPILSPKRMIIGDFSTKNNDANSIQLRNDPRLVHPREFEIGNKWTTFSDPWLSKSTITDKKDIIINDREYRSYEIMTENILGYSEFTYYSYFDSHGLVKRVAQNEMSLINEDGDSLGTMITRSVVNRLNYTE